MKKLLTLIMTFVLLMSLISCGDQTTTAPENVSVVIKPSSTSVFVGDKVEFSVVISGAPKAKSVGIELQYDNEFFELVSGDMNMKGDLSDFSDGTGVVAFSTATDINKTIMIFTLKATAAASAESVKCQISIKDAQDASVEVPAENITKATIAIKSK